MYVYNQFSISVITVYTVILIFGSTGIDDFA